MMKKTVLGLIMMIACCMAHAQLAATSRNTSKIGVMAEWNLSSPVTNLNDMVSIYQNGSGFSAGVFYNIPIYNNFYFEPNLKLYYNTIIVAPDNVQAHILDYKVPPQGSLRNWGFRVPFRFGYRFDFTDDIAMSVFTGPQINVGLSLKQHFNDTDTGHELYDNGWHRVDADWAFGVRFHYADNWVADISGSVGLTNMVGGDAYKNVHFRRNAFAIGVGYMF